MNRRQRAWGGGGLSLLFMAGCGGDSDVSPYSVSVALEEGTPVVQIEQLWDGDWPALPGFQIDTLVAPDDPDLPSMVAPAHAAILADGTLAVADVLGGQIWLRSPEGEWVVGPRRGQGPDDLRSIGGVWGDDDALLVLDGDRQELVRYPDRRTASQRIPLAPSPASGGPSLWPFELHRVGAARWVVVIPTPTERGEDGVSGELTSRLVEFGSEGGVEGDLLAQGPAHPLFVNAGGGAPVPYAHRAFTAAAAPHEGAPGGVAFTAGSEPFVRSWDASGAPGFQVRWASPSRPLEDHHRDRFLAQMRDTAPPGIPPEQFDALLAMLEPAIPWPEALPHMGGLRKGSDGSVWLGGPERVGLEISGRPEAISEWRAVSFRPALGSESPEASVHRIQLPEGAHLLNPVDDGLAGQPAFFVLLRDAMDRTGVAVLRYDLP